MKRGLKNKFFLKIFVFNPLLKEIRPLVQYLLLLGLNAGRKGKKLGLSWAKLSLG